MHEVIFHSPQFYDEVAAHAGRHLHLILIATKPDIIKQVPLYRELKERGHPVLLGHTGQHYDENLSGGMLKEFGVEPDFNLNVRGSMYEVVSQIIGRLGKVMQELKARGKTVIPYVHGDTTTAMAAANAGYCHGFASVHVEAGIRTLTPEYRSFQLPASHSGLPSAPRLASASSARRRDGFEERASGPRTASFQPAEWREFLMDRNNWVRGSLEPFPEQFNTRCSEAGSGIHLAPVELDREFLLNEGFPEDRIFVVGNSVADALRDAMANADAAGVFDRYPQLRDGNFVRFCIHRRENCTSQHRFRAIYDAMKGLILDGRTVLLISLFQTEAAFDRFGLRQEVEELARTHKHFVHSPVWAQYGDVVAAMSRAAVCATDSGSMQEEMNAMSIPCVTLRFGSDRSESVLCGGNIIAPPVSGDIVRQIIEFAWDNPAMRSAPKIYGSDVSAKCIDAVEAVLQSGAVFRTEEERLQF